MKAAKIFYWITTALISANFLMAGIMYFAMFDEMVKGFAVLGLPVWFLYFLGTAKIIAGIGIIIPAPARLKEWAYAGITFTLIGAIVAHVVSDTPFISPLVVLAILAVSYILRLKVYPNR